MSKLCDDKPLAKGLTTRVMVRKMLEYKTSLVSTKLNKPKLMFTWVKRDTKMKS